MAEPYRIAPRSPSLEADLLGELRAGGVATTHEAFGRRGLLDPAIRPIQTGAVVAGTAVTVLTEPDDNLMIHAAVERCAEGDVLVVGVTEESSHGLVGELLATALRYWGVAGLVLDAGIRDTQELRAMGFPAWSRVVSARGATKKKAGSVNVPVVCGGQEVRPGDAVVADDDGVVCVAREEVADVARRARERRDEETHKRSVFAAGTLSLDLYGLRPTLDALGVVSDGSVSDDSGEETIR